LIILIISDTGKIYGQIDRIIEGKTDEEKPPVSRTKRKAVAPTGVSESHIKKFTFPHNPY